MKNLLAKIFLIITCFLMLSSAYGQELKGGRYSKGKNKVKRSSTRQLKANKTDVFPLDRIYRLGGPSIAPGITYTFPGAKSTETDTIQKSTADPKGKMGYYFEISWFHSFINPSLFHYMDFGLSYKSFKGTEDFTRETQDPTSNGLLVFSEQKSFNDQFISAHYNLTNHWHFSRYGFLNNSIGVNVDYNISKSRSSSLTFNNESEKFVGDINGQLHYKIGVGWRVSPRILVIPSVETPILTLYEFDDLKSTLPYFHSRYRPVIFSVRILLLRLDQENCNVPNYDGPSNFE